MEEDDLDEEEEGEEEEGGGGEEEQGEEAAGAQVRAGTSPLLALAHAHGRVHDALQPPACLQTTASTTAAHAPCVVRHDGPLPRLCLALCAGVSSYEYSNV